MGEKVISLLAAMLGIATISVLVQSANTSKVINASGGAFVASVRAVMGK